MSEDHHELNHHHVMDDLWLYDINAHRPCPGVFSSL